MKKRRPRLQLSDEQQLGLGLLLVILLAISLLYCLGFASLALREAWENTSLPWTTPETGLETLDVTPALMPPVTPSTSPTPALMPPVTPSTSPTPASRGYPPEENRGRANLPIFQPFIL